MTNFNIGQFMLDIADFIASLCDKLYAILFFPIDINIPLLHVQFSCTVFQLIGAAGAIVFVTILIIRIIRG